MQRLSQGQVVQVAVPDPRGQNKKLRPVVILTDTSELSDSTEFVVAAISTKLTDPLPPDWIEVPFSPGGHGKTGLSERSVVKCRWLRRVSPSDVVSVLGHLNPKIMKSIMEIVRQN